MRGNWLHRGPFLRSMPLFVYAAKVRRVTKPKSLQKNVLHFPFDSHYLLSTMYCQTLSLQSWVPRLIGPHLPLPEEAEDHAAYMSMLFSTYHGQGVGCCADPLNARPLLFENVENNVNWIGVVHKWMGTQVTAISGNR